MVVVYKAVAVCTLSAASGQLSVRSCVCLKGRVRCRSHSCAIESMSEPPALLLKTTDACLQLSGVTLAPAALCLTTQP